MSNEFLNKFEHFPIFKKLTPEWISIIIGGASSERRLWKPEGLKSEHRDGVVGDHSLINLPMEIEYLPFLFLVFINSKTEEKYFV